MYLVVIPHQRFKYKNTFSTNTDSLLAECHNYHSGNFHKYVRIIVVLSKNILDNQL